MTFPKMRSPKVPAASNGRPYEGHSAGVERWMRGCNDGVVLVEAGKHLMLLKFRVLGRLSTVVLGALDSVIWIVELESLRRLSC